MSDDRNVAFHDSAVDLNLDCVLRIAVCGDGGADRIPVGVWRRLIKDLRRRGHGHRESGAFLLGTRGPKQDVVRAYVCYDDLDPQALDTGIVIFGSAGFGVPGNALLGGLGAFILAEVLAYGLRLREDVEATI